MKGIILAGGEATRLYPVTSVVNKHLLPIYDKPMIYYPITVLMLAGIRQMMVITAPRHLAEFQRLLGDGSQWGIEFDYATQPRPEGIAQAFLIAGAFIADDSCALILGDNIFFGNGLSDKLHNAVSRRGGATVFAYQVPDPERFGIVTLDRTGRPTAIEEKPKRPRSNWALTGLYFYDNDVVKIAQTIEPGPRGELEITEVNARYLERNALNVEVLNRGFAWFDAGTHDSLVEASVFVHTIGKRQNQRIAVPEEVAFLNGWIGHDQLAVLGDRLKNSGYGEYLLQLQQMAGRQSSGC